MTPQKWFAISVFAILVLAASSAVALEENDPEDIVLLAAQSGDSPSSLDKAVDGGLCAGECDLGCGSSRSCPRWKIAADFIVFERSGNVDRTLVERVPGSVPPQDLANAVGVEALNANDLREGFCGGPRLSLIRRGDCGYDWEVTYFQIDGWSDARTVGPDNPPDWLVMKAPGGFLQIQDHPDQAMVWVTDTKFYNAELNLRWNPCSRIAVLAGFRWMELNENLQGILEPPTFSWEPPFWNTSTTNNLFGFQIGAEGVIWEHGRFSINGTVKAGVFDNNASQRTDVSIFKIAWPSSAATNHAAFLGETGVQCRFQVTKGLAFRAGYEAIWLEGVALAAGQIDETHLTPPITETALGVNCNSGVFFHGATVGLEYSF